MFFVLIIKVMNIISPDRNIITRQNAHNAATKLIAKYSRQKRISVVTHDAIPQHIPKRIKKRGMSFPRTFTNWPLPKPTLSRIFWLPLKNLILFELTFTIVVEFSVCYLLLNECLFWSIWRLTDKCGTALNLTPTEIFSRQRATRLIIILNRSLWNK